MEVSSFLIPKKCSISARYERSMTNMMASSTTTASTTSNGNDGERRYGLATAYYFRGHSSKITADWVQIVDNDGGLDTNQVSTRTEDNRFRIQWLVKF